MSCITGCPIRSATAPYNVSKSLKAGAFKLLGSDRHYTAYLRNMSYPGNDCSAFVSMSIWGLGTSRSLLRSRDIKSSSAYRTVATRSNMKGYQQLRPGDRACEERACAHVPLLHQQLSQPDHDHPAGRAARSQYRKLRGKNR